MYLKLPSKLHSKVNDELKPGESVVWAGQPIPNRRMRAGFLAWGFFIPFTAFAIIWTTATAGLQAIDFTKDVFSLMPLFGLFFVLIGLCGLSMPFWMRAAARRTAYVITDQRILTISGISATKYRSYRPEQINFIERKENSDGSGDLIFSRETYRDNQGANRTTEEGVYAVENVKAVESYIENLLQSKKSLRESNHDVRA